MVNPQSPLYFALSQLSIPNEYRSDLFIYLVKITTMKKLILLTTLFLAFSCSKDDESGDDDPIVGKWTMTHNSYPLNWKMDVKADGKATQSGETVNGECLFVWKNLKIEKMEKMLYQFTFCGIKKLDGTISGSCDDDDVDQQILDRYKWYVEFNEDFSEGNGFVGKMSQNPDEELTEEQEQKGINDTNTTVTKDQN